MDESLYENYLESNLTRRDQIDETQYWKVCTILLTDHIHAQTSRDSSRKLVSTQLYDNQLFNISMSLSANAPSSKHILTPFAQADVKPEAHSFSKPIIDGIMGRSFLTPRMKIRVRGKCLYTSSTPWVDGGRIDAAALDELVAKKLRGEDLPTGTKLAEQISIALDDDSTKALEDYFGVIATECSKAFVDANIFTRNIPAEVAKFNFISPLSKQQNGKGVLRPSVEADSMKNAPTVRFAKEANEAGDDYVYEDGCVKDLRSISDGGNGLLRGATVVVLLEETGCASSLFPTSHAK
tara:strand:- start:1331 stop:2215 length:885 start_codon:yes stop_codon:yes gene_type:complete